MPTISGLRRRGYTPESIRDFCSRIGVAKKENVIDVAQLEHSIREDLNRRAPRVMGVLRPLKVVITNYPGGPGRRGRRHQQPGGSGRRHPASVPFSRVLLHRARRFHGEIRRRSSSGCRPARKCASAAPTSSPAPRSSRTIAARSWKLRCTYDPATRGGDAPDGRRVKATAALGVREPRDSGRSAAVRSPLHRAGSRERARGQDVPRLISIRRRSKSCASVSWNRASRRPSRASACSSSVSAISASIQTHVTGALRLQSHGVVARYLGRRSVDS